MQTRNIRKGKEQLFFFGWGTLLIECFDEICSIVGSQPVCILDTSPSKIGKYFKGVLCNHVSILKEFDSPVVVLTVRRDWPLDQVIQSINPSAQLWQVEFWMAEHKAVHIRPYCKPEQRCKMAPTGVAYSGKRALVTGATRGIGRAIAFKLSKLGFDLVIVGKSPVDLENLADKLRVFNVNIEQVVVDLAEDITVHSIFTKTCFGAGFDLIFNNAAVAYPERLIGINKISHEEMLRSYSTNVVAQIAIAEHFVKFASQDRCTRTIFLTSNSNDHRNIAYTLTKAAINKYVFDAFYEFKRRGMILYLLDPGNIQTRMNPNGTSTVDKIFPGALLPLWLNPLNNTPMIHASEFSEQTLETAIDTAVLKYPNLWETMPMDV